MGKAAMSQKEIEWVDRLPRYLAPCKRNDVEMGMSWNQSVGFGLKRANVISSVFLFPVSFDGYEDKLKLH